MRDTDRLRSVPTSRAPRPAALIAVIALVAGCSATTVSPSPLSTATAGPTATHVATPSPAVTPMPEPTSSPAAPTTTPAPTKPGPRWEQADVPGWVAQGRPVVLADGRVLVIGDLTSTIWDPATGRWKPVEGFNKQRSQFAAIRLADGRVLVTGGLNSTNQSFSSAYTWDPATETWTKVGLMAQARTDPSIAALPDGRILVAGGYFAIERDWGFAMPSLDLALAKPDDATNVTLAAVKLPLADIDMPPNGRALATAEIFNPATGLWSKAPAMRYARAGAPAVTLADGRVLVAGAAAHELGLDWDVYRTAEIFDPATGRWSLANKTELIPSSELRRLGIPDWVADAGTGGDGLDPGRLIALDGGDAVLIGRSEWAKHQGEETRSFRFDTATSTWREIGTPWLAAWENDGPYGRTYTSPGPRWLGSAVVKLRDGRVLVAGGGSGGMETEGGPTRAARLYNPATDTWTKLPDLPVAVEGAGVLLADGSILILGDYPKGADGDLVRTLVRFVPGP